MNKDEILSKIKSNPLFEKLDAQQIDFIVSNSTLLTIPENNFLIRERDVSNDVYLILSGEARVLKLDEKSGESLPISILKPGDVVGEMTLIDHSPRSASVQAGKDLQVLLLPFNKETAPEQKAIFTQITANISRQLTQKLRLLNDVTVRSLRAELESAKVRVETGKFFFLLLVIICSWVLALSVAQKLVRSSGLSSAISWPLIFAVLLSIIRFLKNSIYPPQFYGLTLKNWKRNLLEGILFTLPILVLATILKWWLVTYVPSLNHLSVIQPIVLTSKIPPFWQVVFPLIYICLVPLQEFIARGVLQSSIKGLLSENVVVWSIILSNLLFAVFHTHISPEFALAAFCAGCFWGWLRQRQDSLIGSIISHALIGGWCLSVLNFGYLMGSIK